MTIEFNLKNLILDAIKKTINENIVLSTPKLQKFVKMNEDAPSQLDVQQNTPISM